MNKFHLLELKCLIYFSSLKFVVERCWKEGSNSSISVVKEVKSSEFSLLGGTLSDERRKVTFYRPR